MVILPYVKEPTLENGSHQRDLTPLRRPFVSEETDGGDGETERIGELLDGCDEEEEIGIRWR